MAKKSAAATLNTPLSGEKAKAVEAAIAQIENKDASDAQKEAALDFIHFLTSDTAKDVYEKYCFDTKVK